ncbi:UPF0262 family protein [Lacibacterium aquatile]|uniref:UPF0262 protein ACFSM5_18760 n=1 Tax=Lacibacterium aquatile TaxID=1168082 RepID=A0ABW5DWW3_9PROT
MAEPDAATQRIIDVRLDERSVVRRNQTIEHERAVAIFDLLEENLFDLRGHPPGPYKLMLGIEESRLVFDVRDENDGEVDRIQLPLVGMRGTIRDYFTICDSYYGAIKNQSLAQIETLDMARRGLHNEAAEMLRERLVERVGLDLDTARRLFTLICVLHIRG